MSFARPWRVRNLAEIWRYYQAAVINTAFGFGLFALLIWLGVHLFVAQIVAQVLGVAFNYVVYSRHVFRDATGSKWKFILAYVVNYLFNLGFLAIFHMFIPSAYIAGFLATGCASLVNYFALKYAVFAK